jgi:inhibitor of KinA
LVVCSAIARQAAPCRAFLFVSGEQSSQRSDMTLAALGDTAVVVTLGNTIDESTLLRVRSLAKALESDMATGLVDIVPAYATVTVFYDANIQGADGTTPFDRVSRLIEQRWTKVENSWPDLLRVHRGTKEGGIPSRQIEVPVCYEEEFAPDLGVVAKHTGLDAPEVISLHTRAIYLVHAVGFTPGFAYLGGLPEKLHTPRRPSPRLTVPAGSVGIGWKQTGVYPSSTPGGWQLIGRTPLRLFDVAAVPAALLQVGDHVRFSAISAEEFRRWT